MPNTLKIIDKRVFNNCNKLEYLRIPDSVEDVGHNAIYGLHSLKEIVIPETVEEIECNALYVGFTNGLKRVSIPKHFMTKQKLEDIGIYRCLKNSREKVELIES